MKAFVYFALAFAFACYSESSAKTTTINCNPKKGDKFNFKTEMGMNISTSQEGMDIKVDTKNFSDAQVECLEKTDDYLSFYQRILDGKLYMGEIPMAGIKRDTVSFSDLPSLEFIKINNKGEKIVDSIIKPLKMNFNNPMMQNFGGASSNGTAAMNCFFNFSKKTFSPNDTFSISADNYFAPAGLDKKMLNGHIKTLYTFICEVDTLGYKCAKFKAQIVDAKFAGTIDTAGTSIKIDGEMRSLGNAYFCIDDGVLVASRDKAEADYQMTVQGPYRMTISMQMDMNIDNRRVKNFEK